MTYRVRNVTIAIALACVAALLTLFYVTNYRRSVQQGQSTIHVYVAAHNIAAATQDRTKLITSDIPLLFEPLVRR